MNLSGDVENQAICSIIAPRKKLGPNVPDAIRDLIWKMIAGHSLPKHLPL